MSGRTLGIILEDLSRESGPCLTASKRVDEPLKRHLEIPAWEEFVEGHSLKTTKPWSWASHDMAVNGSNMF